MEILRQVGQFNQLPFRNQFRDVEDAVIIQTVQENEFDIQTQSSYKRSPFIEANTTPVLLSDLRNDFIPVFSKDNESSISHTEFIEVVYAAISSVFPRETISNVACRVSHKVCGRVPSAVGKPTAQLEDWEKTQYYERMSFCIEIPTIKDNISNHELVLSIVGVRAYNHTNLYGKKGVETFKLAIGFLNRVCTNLCASSEDGLATEIRVSSLKDLQLKALELFQNYNAQKHLEFMKQFPQMNLTESQFATLLGRARLYGYLPKHQQKELPVLSFGDAHLNTIAKDYYHDKRFCKSDDGNLNLWNLYNLFTNANRSSSYIDTFLNRSGNATDFITGISNALKGDEAYKWFLS